MKLKQKDRLLYTTPFDSRGYFVKVWDSDTLERQCLVRFYPDLEHSFKQIKINKNQIVK